MPLLPGAEVSGAPEGFDVEETGVTLLQNAWIKAAALRGQVADDALVLADDSGLVVHALGGRPGVFSSRYAGPDATYADNCRRLLEELEGVEDREAAFVLRARRPRPGRADAGVVRDLLGHDRPGDARLRRLRLRPALPARGRATARWRR